MKVLPSLFNLLSSDGVVSNRAATDVSVSLSPTFNYKGKRVIRRFNLQGTQSRWEKRESLFARLQRYLRKQREDSIALARHLSSILIRIITTNRSASVYGLKLISRRQRKESEMFLMKQDVKRRLEE